MADVSYLECLAWAVYDGVLLVGPPPELLGSRPWCMVLAGLQRLYKGHEDVAHCPPQMLSSWDHEERVEALHRVGGLSFACSGRRQASWSQRRSQSASPCRSQMWAWDGQSHAPSPHMPSRYPHGATLPPCVTMRCYCSATASHDLSTTPKVASTVNTPPHTRSSHSGEGTARPSLDHDEALEDDFQTQHTPVHRVMRREDTGH